MIPTTVVTGALGSGKTTIILNAIKQLPDGYKTLWLKNEYGDVNIDSILANESNIQTKEILNGCLCCVLVGRLHNALEEIAAKGGIDRLIIETAGTAYPFPVINQILRVEGLKLDGLILVVDSLNFTSFKDKSELAKAQKKYIDLIIVNKLGVVDDEQKEKVLDDVFELYSDVPKVESKDGNVDKDILFGLDSKSVVEEYDEVHHDDIDVFTFSSNKQFEKEKVITLLESIKNKNFIRIKGVLRFENGYEVLNYVYGKYDFTKISKYKEDSKLVFMSHNINELLKDFLNKSLQGLIDN